MPCSSIAFLILPSSSLAESLAFSAAFLKLVYFETRASSSGIFSGSVPSMNVCPGESLEPFTLALFFGVLPFFFAPARLRGRVAVTVKSPMLLRV